MVGAQEVGLFQLATDDLSCPLKRPTVLSRSSLWPPQPLAVVGGGHGDAHSPRRALRGLSVPHQPAAPVGLGQTRP